jgi:hypothetical protein
MNIALAPEVIFEVMKEHEQSLACLYELYAAKFLDYKGFWIELSLEELQHADWIDKLQADIEDSSEEFIVERFPLGAIQCSTEFVNNQTIAADQPDFVLINALSTALRLEEALIENKYFEVIETDSAKTKRTLAMLAQSTREHYQRIRQLWLEHK